MAAKKKKKVSKKKLTPKQAKFVREYLIDLNATQAAIRAGYSEKTAQAIATENLSKPLVAEAIADHTRKAIKKNDLTIQKVLDSIADMLRRAILAENFAGEGKAIEMQAKYLKMLTDKTELTAPDGVNLTIIGA